MDELNSKDAIELSYNNTFVIEVINEITKKIKNNASHGSCFILFDLEDYIKITDDNKTNLLIMLTIYSKLNDLGYNVFYNTKADLKSISKCIISWGNLNELDKFLFQSFITKGVV